MRLTRQAALAIALVCGLGAAVLAWIWIAKQSPKPPAEQAPETVQIPVPIRTIPAQMNLQPEMFRLVTLARSKVSGGVITDPTALTGQVSLAELPEGQPVKAANIAVRSQKLGLSYTLAPGTRLIAVSLDIIGTVADWVQPGNYVDVLASFQKNGNYVVRTVVQDVRVLAVGTETSVTPPAAQEAPADGSAPKKTETPRAKEVPVTLAVSPTQAQLIMTADVAGDLRLSLRAMGDHSLVPLPPANSWSLIGSIPKENAGAATPATPPQPQPQPQPYYGPQGPQNWGGPPTVSPQAPRPPSVEVIRGGQREIVTPQ